MARKIVACPACKSRFDVSSFEPGSKIRCGSCHKILMIPAESAGAAPAPRPPAAPVPARKKSAAPRTPVPNRKKVAGPARKPAPPPPPDQPARAPQARAPVAEKPAAPAPTRGTQTAPPREVPPAPTPQPAPKPAPTPAPVAREPEQDPLLGQVINNEFELMSVLGQGGYGTVYMARDMALKRKVALKLMLREKTTNKEFVDKFLREARTAAMLTHPNIVRIHLVGFSAALQQHFLAMEYVEGITLSDIMAKGPVPADQAVDIMMQAANGLAEAHRKNIIHRDIKPGNVMITPKGVVKIADFGLAKVYDPDAEASTVIGTPYFMPPEQFEGKARDGRTDIYALGVTFYYMLTLKRPFEGRTPAEVLMNILRSDPVPPMEHNPDVPEALWPIIRRMIARKLDDRYSTCDEILRDLKDFKSGADSEEKAFCPSCGFANSFAAKACLECGASLLEPCPSCGTPDVVGAKFCGSCGVNLTEQKAISGLVAEAESHVASGRLEQAIDKFAAAKDLSPENSAVVEGLRRTEEAISERDRLIRSIESMIEDGSFIEALPLAEEAAERFPGYEPVAALQGRVLGGAKGAQLSAALEEARILLHSGDLFDACAAARRGLELDPDSEEARQLLDQAEAALKEHVTARDEAMELEEQRRLSEALAAWRRALAVLPGDEVAEQAVSRIEGVLDQLSRLRARATAALAEQDLRSARSALEDAVGVLPGDPDTVELITRLRQAENDVSSRFTAALTSLADGNFDTGSAQLRELRGDYHHAERVAEAAEKALLLNGIAEYFRDTGQSLLGKQRLGLARSFLEVASRLAPADEQIASLLQDARRSLKAAEKRLDEARGMLAESKFARALEVLQSLGGILSPDLEVAELTARAQTELFELRAASRDRKQELVQAALRTARELFASGRVQAAHAACQKALRTDPAHEEARALKSEVDRSLARMDDATGDSKIETAFFEFDEFGEDE